MSDQSSRPFRVCDVVMKGGITSGVVYPKALSELAKEFRLKNIGGTSAGAIAAAAAAAAECGRRSGRGGFKALEELPEQLGERVTGTRTRLFEFFQPQSQTKRVFDTLVAGLQGAIDENEPPPAEEYPADDDIPESDF